MQINIQNNLGARGKEVAEKVIDQIKREVPEFGEDSWYYTYGDVVNAYFKLKLGRDDKLALMAYILDKSIQRYDDTSEIDKFICSSFLKLF